MIIILHIIFIMFLNNKQQFALECIKNKKTIFLTGSPGTGKSYTLKEIINYLKSENINYAVTSSTGCSAVLINGQTIHSYMNLGIGQIQKDTIIKKLKANKRYNTIKTLECLIIDEISMIDNYTFDSISSIFKEIKGVNEPFGGIQLIIVGDFCQLSPVSGDYCFKSDEWKNINPHIIILNELMRQKDDMKLQSILQEVRLGKCSKNTFKELKKLQNTQFDNIKPTKLFSLVSNVDKINAEEYSKLFKKTFHIPIEKGIITECFPYVKESEIDFELLTTSSNGQIYKYNAVSNDKKNKLSEYTINLFVGLQVMVTRNISVEKGLINGTIGIITTLTNEYVGITDKYNNNHKIFYHKDVNENTKTYIKFMPIKLAYAMSIHKSQGATLDAIEIDGGVFIFAPGQLYTAISRAKNLESIKLIDIDKDSFICNKDVKKFYEEITERE